MTCLWVSEGRVSTVLPLCPKISFFFFFNVVSKIIHNIFLLFVLHCI